MTQQELIRKGYFVVTSGSIRIGDYALIPKKEHFFKVGQHVMDLGRNEKKFSRVSTYHCIMRKF